MVHEVAPEVKLDTDFRTTVSEDFAAMMQSVPGCYFHVGSANAEKGLNAPHHHPKFDVDEQAMALGAAVMVGAIMEMGKPE